MWNEWEFFSNIKASAGRRPQRLIALLFFLLFAVLGGCASDTDAPAQSDTSAVPQQSVSAVITVHADPSLDEIKEADPYGQISKMALDAYNPDRDLYNALFRAADDMEASVDVSGFPLSISEKARTCDSLYPEGGFQFYYLKYVRLSSDGNTVNFTYTDTGEQAEKNREQFCAKLNHLVYNVAPEDESPLQKLFSVYDYIVSISDYTDSSDPSTFTPYSILMNGKGICNGYANLGYFVFNRVGIPTDYLSNEAHAWNMVRLNGKNYHTDMTWGAGSYGSDFNSLKTILMDDDQRRLGLEAQGYGQYPIIEGYPRQDPQAPEPATDKSFAVYYDFNYEYALDVENNAVYYSDDTGIREMSLDGKNQKTLSPLQSIDLTVFNGVLYFISSADGSLYRLEPGKEASRMDDSVKVYDLKLDHSQLLCGYYEGDTKKEKSFDLSPFNLSGFDPEKSEHQPSVTLPSRQTFRFDIKFSQKMNTDVLPAAAVGLVDSEGQALPIHLFWSADGQTLSVRSKDALDQETSVTLYVLPGITAAYGSKLGVMYDAAVKHSD